MKSLANRIEELITEYIDEVIDDKINELTTEDDVRHIIESDFDDLFQATIERKTIKLIIE